MLRGPLRAWQIKLECWGPPACTPFLANLVLALWNPELNFFVYRMVAAGAGKTGQLLPDHIDMGVEHMEQAAVEEQRRVRMMRRSELWMD